MAASQAEMCEQPLAVHSLAAASSDNGGEAPGPSELGSSEKVPGPSESFGF